MTIIIVDENQYNLNQPSYRGIWFIPYSCYLAALYVYYTGLAATKPVFGASDKARLKPILLSYRD